MVYFKSGESVDTEADFSILNGPLPLDVKKAESRLRVKLLNSGIEESELDIFMDFYRREIRISERRMTFSDNLDASMEKADELGGLSTSLFHSILNEFVAELDELIALLEALKADMQAQATALSEAATRVLGKMVDIEQAEVVRLEELKAQLLSPSNWIETKIEVRRRVYAAVPEHLKVNGPRRYRIDNSPRGRRNGGIRPPVTMWMPEFDD